MKKFLVFGLVLLLVFQSCALASHEIERASNRFLYAKCNNVTIREDCNSNSLVIGTLEEREIIYGLEFLVGIDGKNWILAETQAGVGYVCEDYLVYIVDDIYPITTILQLTEDAYVMEEPSRNAQVYKVIPAGTDISVNSFYPSRGEGTWAAITVSSKIDGYISIKSLCNLDGSKFPFLPEFVTVKRDTKTYQDATRVSPTNIVLYEGDILRVKYYVKLSDGSIMANCINRNKEDVGFILINNLAKY